MIYCIGPPIKLFRWIVSSVDLCVSLADLIQKLTNYNTYSTWFFSQLTCLFGQPDPTIDQFDYLFYLFFAIEKCVSLVFLSR